LTLVAATVATVNLPVNAGRVEVLNRDGAAEVYFTVNGTAPTVGGDDTHVLPAAISSVEVNRPRSGDAVVKLISAGTPAVSVRAL
jgi:hypothetical protein